MKTAVACTACLLVGFLAGTANLARVVESTHREAAEVRHENAELVAENEEWLAMCDRLVGAIDELQVDNHRHRVIVAGMRAESRLAERFIRLLRDALEEAGITPPREPEKV